MRIRFLLLLFLGFAAVMFPLDSSARIGSTVHVAQLDARCSDEASGKADRPFCSIGAAALKVTPGQTVLVAAGDYRERVIIHRSGTRRAPIAFVALPGANVSLSEGKNGFYLSDASWVSISGFTITGTTSYDQNSGIETVHLQYDMSDCRISSTSSSSDVNVDLTLNGVISENGVSI